MRRALSFITSLFSIAAVATGSGHAATPKSGNTKVVVGYLFAQPNATAPPEIISSSGGEVVQQYDGATVGTIPYSMLTGLRQLGTGSGVSVIDKDDFDILYLPGGPVDTRVGVMAAYPGKPLAPQYAPGERGLYLVQFAGPIMNSWISDVRATGAVPVQYLAQNGFVIAATPEQAAMIAQISRVQFLDRFHPFLKPAISAPTGERLLTYVQIANVPGADVALDELQQRSSTTLDIERASGEILIKATLDGSDIAAMVTHPLVFGVVDFPHVEFSDERVATSVTRNVSAPSPTQAGPTNPGTYTSWLAEICPYCTTLQPDGFWVGLADTGLDGGNPAVSGNETAVHHADLPNSRIRYGSNLRPPPDDQDLTLRDTSYHGTFVAGVMAGAPSPSAATDDGGYFWGTGIAPSAGIFITQINVTSVESLTPISLSATDARITTSVPHVYVQNHSYNQYNTQGCPASPPHYDGRYSILSRNFDRAVIDANGTGPKEPITLVVSGGNRYGNANPPSTTCMDQRLTLPPATAKNVIAVGSAESSRSEAEQWGCYATQATSFNNISHNGKRGTEGTNWFKPDLFAPSTEVSSLLSSAVSSPNSNAFCVSGSVTDVAATYLGGSGSSFAAPVGAAAALLASRVYAESIQRDCHATANCDPAAASPALHKAMLIAGARTMRNGIDRADTLNYPIQVGTAAIDPLPSQRQGFGRINLEDVLAAYPAHAYVNEDQSLTAPLGQAWSRTYTVHDSGLPVKIVLAWTDVPALESSPDTYTGYTISPLMNDLDLTVEWGNPCMRFVGNSLSVANESRDEESNATTCTTGTFDRSNNVEIARFFPTVSNISTFTVKVSYFSGSGTQPFSLALSNAYQSGGTVPPTTPLGVTATPSLNPSKIRLTWTATAGATSYEVQRRSANGYYSRIAVIVSGTSYDDLSVASQTAYFYRVRAVNTAGASPYCAPVAATLFQFSESITDTQTVIKATHVEQLRSAINLFRQAAGQGNYNFTNSSLSGLAILATHVNELRAALDQARSAIGMSATSYTDNSITPGITCVKGIHIRELRQSVNGVSP